MNQKRIFTNILGSFVFNSKSLVIDKSDNEIKLKQKYNNALSPDSGELKSILGYFNKKEFYSEFRNKNILLAKKLVKESVKEDNLIINAISNIEELNKITNTLVKRLREWYGLYLPELSHEVEDNEHFVSLVLTKSKKQLFEQIHLSGSDSMGADLSDFDLKQMMNLCREIESLYKLRESHKQYLNTLINKLCPNMTAIAGSLIGAKLIEHAGSIQRLAKLPASTVQLLGAEKALFRHMKSGAKAPKYGVIFDHSLINSASKTNKGKAARSLADKISIAVRVDYFKGKFIGDKLREELDKKMKGYK